MRSGRLRPSAGGAATNGAPGSVLAVDPTRLSDAELEAELRMRASSRDCELTVEREGSYWQAAFKQFSDQPGIPPLGVPLLSVDAPDRRWALERLLWLAEDRT
jgi:hypothetical protein